MGGGLSQLGGAPKQGTAVGRTDHRRPDGWTTLDLIRFDLMQLRRPKASNGGRKDPEAWARDEALVRTRFQATQVRGAQYSVCWLCPMLSRPSDAVWRTTGACASNGARVGHLLVVSVLQVRKVTASQIGLSREASSDLSAVAATVTATIARHCCWRWTRGPQSASGVDSGKQRAGIGGDARGPN